MGIWRARSEWRRGRDSNPRKERIPLQQISNLPQSTTLPPLRAVEGAFIPNDLRVEIQKSPLGTHLPKDLFRDEERGPSPDRQRDGVARTGVHDFHRGIRHRDMQFGEKGAAIEATDDDTVDRSAELRDHVLEQVVGHRTRGPTLEDTAVDRLRLEPSDDDGKLARSVTLSKVDVLLEIETVAQDDSNEIDADHQGDPALEVDVRFPGSGSETTTKLQGIQRFFGGAEPGEADTSARPTDTERGRSPVPVQWYAVPGSAERSVPGPTRETRMTDVRHFEVPRLPRRQRSSHKGDHGRVLVIGGARGMTGAACLATTAALRGGAGLVTAAVPASCAPIVTAAQPCAMTLPLADADGSLRLEALDQIIPVANASDAIVMGPGLGRTEPTRRLVRALLPDTGTPTLADPEARTAIP